MDDETKKTACQDKLKAIQSQTVWFTAFAWVFVAMGFLAAIVGWCALIKNGNSFSLGNLASYGSFLQGAVASLWSLAAFLFIYVAFLGQKQQLLQQDLELEGQTVQFKLQHESIKKQNFESAFFQLLHLHSQVVAEMHLRDSGAQGEGRECLRVLYDQLKNAWRQNIFRKIPDEPELKFTMGIYANFYSYYQLFLGHYCRNLYHLIKFVKFSDVLKHENPEIEYQNRRRYTSLVRAQLSQNELALLFYNCICPVGEKFKPLVEEFGLLENLDIEKMLFHPSHKEFYDPRAFK